MMNSEDKTIGNNNNNHESSEEIRMETNENDGDTYPVSDNESASLVEKNLIQDELNETMSDDSLMNENENQLMNCQDQSMKSSRINNLDEHIKLVKQKKKKKSIIYVYNVFKNN